MKIRFILLVLFFYASVISAQSDSLGLTNDEIINLVNKLGVKLLLNDKQKSEITRTLTEYASEISSLKLDGKFTDELNKTIINKTDEKILSNFDEKQKMKYEILKKEWWSQISTEEND